MLTFSKAMGTYITVIVVSASALSALKFEPDTAVGFVSIVFGSLILVMTIILGIFE